MVDDGLDGRVSGVSGTPTDGIDNHVGNVDPAGQPATSVTGTTRKTAPNRQAAVDELTRKYGITGLTTEGLTDDVIREKSVELGLERDVEAEVRKELRDKLTYLKDVDFHKYVGFPYNAFLAVAQYMPEQVYERAQKVVEKQIAKKIPDLMAGELKKVEDYFRNEGQRLDDKAKGLRSRRVRDMEAMVVGDCRAENVYKSLVGVENELDELENDLAKAVETGRVDLVHAIEMKRVERQDARETMMDQYETITGQVYQRSNSLALEDQLIDRIKLKAGKYKKYAGQVEHKRNSLELYKDLQGIDQEQPYKEPKEIEGMFKDVDNVVKHYRKQMDYSTEDARKLPESLRQTMSPSVDATTKAGQERRDGIDKTRSEMQQLKDAYLHRKVGGQ